MVAWVDHDRSRYRKETRSLRKWPWSSWTKPFWFVAFCALFMNFGMAMQRTIFSNFVAEEMGIRVEQLGWLESVREIPGLLTFLFVGLTALLARNLLVGISVGFVSVGLGMYAGSHNVMGLVLSTTVYSIGFHVFGPLQSAQVLSLAGPGEKARRLGELSSVAALASLLAMGFVYVTSVFLGYRQLFIAAAVITFGGAILMFSLPRVRQAERPRNFVVRSKYWLYYVITLLAASRRQVTNSFAVFALVTIYNTPVQTVAALMFVSNVIAVLTRSFCGQIIDRIGESRAMSIAHYGVIAIFAGYAFIHVPAVLYVLYALDTFLVGFDVAQSTYLDRIAAPGDVPPSLALGVTINHISGVTVPILAGYLWAAFGHQATFTFGATVALVSLYFVRKINSTLSAPSRQAELVAGSMGAGD